MLFDIFACRIQLLPFGLMIDIEFVIIATINVYL